MFKKLRQIGQNCKALLLHAARKAQDRLIVKSVMLPIERNWDAVIPESTTCTSIPVKAADAISVIFLWIAKYENSGII